jgi:hypothetical protein
MSRGPVPVDPDVEYFQSIEEFFVSRRGDPLFLSNADWLLIRGWRQAGLPLRVVRRGISDAMDSHDHSWSRGRKIGSLRYCAAEVDAAAERWREALRGGPDAPPLEDALQKLVDALRGAVLPPRARRVADAVAGGLAERLASDPDPQLTEVWLRDAEERLLAALEADLTDEQRTAIDGEIERDLAPYQGRLPALVLAQVRAESRTRRHLEGHGLPRLSLWAL